jgi:hypothetical protein
MLDMQIWQGSGDVFSPTISVAVNPDAVHDHGQSARQRHDCLLLSAT